MGPSPSSNALWSMMCLNMGNRNAIVFPLPVLAMPIKSRPFIIAGMAWVWMGVGFSYPCLEERKKRYFKDKRGFDRCKSQSHAEKNLYIHIYIYLSVPFKIHSIKMSSKTMMQKAEGISVFHYGVVNTDDSTCNSYKHGHVVLCNEEKGFSHKGTTEDSKQNQGWQSSQSASLLFEGSENLHGNTTLYPGFYWFGAAFSLDRNSLQLQPVHVHLWNRVCINRQSNITLLHQHSGSGPEILLLPPPEKQLLACHTSTQEEGGNMDSGPYFNQSLTYNYMKLSVTAI